MAPYSDELQLDIIDALTSNASKADNSAKRVIQSAFPDRKIISINGIDISMGGGNIHCITQQQPLSI